MAEWPAMDERMAIYKIVSRAEWEAAEAAGRFEGSEVDRRDGFIHLSTSRQVRETAARHFAGRQDLVLVEVDAPRLPLRWEPSRGGDRFPHLYEPLPLAAARSVQPLPLNGDGRHEFPDPL